jgi:hypothetical protein
MILHAGLPDVSGAPQMAVQSDDRIKGPEIKPDDTRVTLQSGVCRCCARRFKAAPPNGFEPGSPFGPNLRAFVLYQFRAGAATLHDLPQGYPLLPFPMARQSACRYQIEYAARAFARNPSSAQQCPTRPSAGTQTNGVSNYR